MNIVIGMKIKNAGTLINPILKGNFTFNIKPEYQNPNAPHNAIIKPIVAALPIAFLLDNQNILILEHSLLHHQYPSVQIRNQKLIQILS